MEVGLHATVRFMLPVLLVATWAACALGAYVFYTESEESVEQVPQGILPQRRVAATLLFGGSLLSLIIPFTIGEWTREIGVETVTLPVKLGSGAMLSLGYFFGLGTYLFRRSHLGRRVRRENAEIIFKAVEAFALILGVVFAMHAATSALATIRSTAVSNGIAAEALRESAKSNALSAEALRQSVENNRVAARAQLYEGDNRVTEAERDNAGTYLQSLYANPDPNCRTEEEARAYVASLIGIVSEDENLKKVVNAEQFYELFYGRGAFTREAMKREDYTSFRRMQLHATLVLNTLHAAYDYMKAGIISEKEYETWAGYFTDIGPHPILLSTIWIWEERHYMSYDFARDVQRRMYVEGTPAQRLVIETFFKRLSSDLEFAAKLPHY